MRSSSVCFWLGSVGCAVSGFILLLFPSSFVLLSFLFHFATSIRPTLPVHAPLLTKRAHTYETNPCRVPILAFVFAFCGYRIMMASYEIFTDCVLLFIVGPWFF